MKVEEAWKLSKIRVAVRGLGTSDARYCAQEWGPDQGRTRREAKDSLQFMYKQTRAKVMPVEYAGIYDDWIPWEQQDPITLLGDLVRLSTNRAQLVA